MPSTVAGRQPTDNGPARIEGTGKGTGTYFVAPDGTYLGGDWQLRSSPAGLELALGSPAADHHHSDDQGHPSPMSRTRFIPGAVLAAALIAACSSGTTANPPGHQSPAPRPGEPAPTPTTSGKGSGRRLQAGPRTRPIGSSGTTVSPLQYPGGATQEQVRDRIAFVHVTLDEASAPGTFNVTVLLDSVQALEGGQPVAPDSVLAARGTRWTATLSSTGGLEPAHHRQARARCRTS